MKRQQRWAFLGGIAAIAALVATSVVVNAGGPGVASGAVEAKEPLRQPIFIVGDSITYASASILMTDLRAVGYDPDINAKPGRTTAEGIAIVKAEGDSLPADVVVALSTNDRKLTEAQFAQRVERMMDIIGPTRRVVWVNAWLDLKIQVDEDDFRPVNRVLAEAAKIHKNLTILDWASFVEKNRSDVNLSTIDGIHYSRFGTLGRAWFVAQGVPKCTKCAPVFRH